jgi:hypothetical protein
LLKANGIFIDLLLPSAETENMSLLSRHSLAIEVHDAHDHDDDEFINGYKEVYEFFIKRSWHTCLDNIYCNRDFFYNVVV